jgi:hypothetical protein
MTTPNIQKYVTDLMEGAVALKGEDYVYPKRAESEDEIGWGGCDYVRDGQPSCIVGHVLVAAGVPVEQLAAHEGNSAWTVVPALKPEWGGVDDDSHYYPESSPIARALDKAQSLQDAGSTWGEALEAFKEELERG